MPSTATSAPRYAPVTEGSGSGTSAREDTPRAVRPQSPGRAARWAPDAAVLGLHVALVLWFAHRSLPHLTTQLIGNFGDTAQFAWGLTYTQWSLLQGQTPLLSHLVEAPHGVNLMWNTSTPFLGAVSAPITLLAGPVLGYNIVLLTVLVANGFSCYLALRRFVAPRLPRAAASLFFGFSPYLIPHANGHLNLTSVFLVPIILVLLHELVIRRQWSPVKLGLALGATLSAQLLMTEELLATEAIAAVVGALLLVALFPRQAALAIREGLALRVAKVSAVTLTVVGIVAVYPLHVQFFGPRRLERGLVHNTEDFVTDLGQLWFPIRTIQWVAGLWDHEQPPFTGGAGEFNGYLGVPLIAVLVASVTWLWRRRPVVRWAAMFLLAMMVLSFGPSLHVYGENTGVWMPWAAVREIWILGSLIPARLALYCDLAAALIVAITGAELLGKAHLRARALAGVVVVPVAISVWPSALNAAPAPTPPFFTTEAMVEEVPRDSTALLLPLSAEGNGTQDDASAIVWHAQSRFHFRMTGGYWLNPSPTGEPQIGPTRTPLVQHILDIQNDRPASMTQEERRAFLAELRSQGVERVLLGPMDEDYGDMLRFLDDLLGAPQADRGGVKVWRL
jgi:hypothetical protein